MCAYILPMRTSREGAEYGACASRAPQQHCKIQGIRALAKGHAPKKHATSPKDLGTYSPREIHLRKPISAHESLLPCTSVWVRLSNIRREQKSLQARGGKTRPLEESASPGKAYAEQKPRKAKFSAHASRIFSLSRARVVPRAILFPHTPWTACTSKGGP